MQHFLANEHDRAQAFKRGGGKQIVSMDDHLIEAEAAMVSGVHGDETSGYDHHWAANLGNRAWEQLHAAMVTEGKVELIEALKLFVVGGPSRRRSFIFLPDDEPLEAEPSNDMARGAQTRRYGHFEILTQPDGSLSELGHGAMGTTYRARDTVLHGVVALKVIGRSVARHPAVRTRFLREARAAAQLQHPNVATVSYYGEQDGECFYAMDAGLAARLRSDTAGAQMAFTAARVEAEKTFAVDPADGMNFSVLAMIDAGLGHTGDAVREGRRAGEMLPPQQWVRKSSMVRRNLAVVYTWTGQTDLALAGLQELIKSPAVINRLLTA